jgi:hypothetical protein
MLQATIPSTPAVETEAPAQSNKAKHKLFSLSANVVTMFGLAIVMQTFRWVKAAKLLKAAAPALGNVKGTREAAIQQLDAAIAILVQARGTLTVHEGKAAFGSAMAGASKAADTTWDGSFTQLGNYVNGITGSEVAVSG